MLHGRFHILKNCLKILPHQSVKSQNPIKQEKPPKKSHNNAPPPSIPKKQNVQDLGNYSKNKEKQGRSG